MVGASIGRGGKGGLYSAYRNSGLLPIKRKSKPGRRLKSPEREKRTAKDLWLLYESAEGGKRRALGGGERRRKRRSLHRIRRFRGKPKGKSAECSGGPDLQNEKRRVREVSTRALGIRNFPNLAAQGMLIDWRKTHEGRKEGSIVVLGGGGKKKMENI